MTGRCKDCRWGRRVAFSGLYCYVYPPRFENGVRPAVDDDDFCSLYQDREPEPAPPARPERGDKEN